jgi:hypothetical protein
MALSILLLLTGAHTPTTSATPLTAIQTHTPPPPPLLFSKSSHSHHQTPNKGEDHLPKPLLPTARMGQPFSRTRPRQMEDESHQTDTKTNGINTKSNLLRRLHHRTPRFFRHLHHCGPKMLRPQGPNLRPTHSRRTIKNVVHSQ